MIETRIKEIFFYSDEKVDACDAREFAIASLCRDECTTGLYLM